MFEAYDVLGRVLLSSGPPRSLCGALSSEMRFSSPLSGVNKLVAFVEGEIGVILLLYVLTLCVRVQLLRLELGTPEVRTDEL